MTSTTYHRPMATATRRPRYRLRTWLRGRLPMFAIGLAPKGKHDCGQHEWYREDELTDRCYHCEVGERPHEPMPLTPAAREALQYAGRAATRARRMV